jgi:hypothetical protein
MQDGEYLVLLRFVQVDATEEWRTAAEAWAWAWTKAWSAGAGTALLRAAWRTVRTTRTRTFMFRTARAVLALRRWCLICVCLIRVGGASHGQQRHRQDSSQEVQF